MKRTYLVSAFVLSLASTALAQPAGFNPNWVRGPDGGAVPTNRQPPPAAQPRPQARPQPPRPPTLQQRVDELEKRVKELETLIARLTPPKDSQVNAPWLPMIGETPAPATAINATATDSFVLGRTTETEVDAALKGWTKKLASKDKAGNYFEIVYHYTSPTGSTLGIVYSAFTATDSTLTLKRFHAN